jgi:hypothetical protein
MSNYNHWFIRARLKTRQLLLLVALDEEGNIHRAAQMLSILRHQNCSKTWKKCSQCPCLSGFHAG